jgi:four helix bundle protein
MARHFSDLTCWQLARGLKKEVTKLLRKPVFKQNQRSRDNLADAASSVRRNIAEGFGRRGHKEFARFLRNSIKDKPDPPWCT